MPPSPFLHPQGGTTAPAATPTPAPPARAAWWRHGHLWLVIAGPVVVVVASFVTLGLAVMTPDPVLSEGYYRRPALDGRTGAHRPDRNLAPALEGRNHAATPVAPQR